MGMHFYNIINKKDMKNMNLRVFAIILAGVLFLGSNQLMSQKGREIQNCPKGAGNHCNIPDLTEAQQKKIDELKLAHQKNMLQFKNQLNEKDARLQTLRTADKADMNEINKTIDEIGAIKTQIMKEKENHRQQVRSQLTDSQKVQFDMNQGGGCSGGCGHRGKGMHGNKASGCGQGMHGDKTPGCEQESK
jgi:Spy/CpxP family protein refolding chaperone